MRTPPRRDRPAVIERMIELFYRERYPGIEVLVRDGRQADALSGKTRRFQTRRRAGIQSSGVLEARPAILSVVATRRRRPATSPSPFR